MFSLTYYFLFEVVYQRNICLIWFKAQNKAQLIVFYLTHGISHIQLLNANSNWHWKYMNNNPRLTKFYNLNLNVCSLYFLNLSLVFLVFCNLENQRQCQSRLKRTTCRMITIIFRDYNMIIYFIKTFWTKIQPSNIEIK